MDKLVHVQDNIKDLRTLMQDILDSDQLDAAQRMYVYQLLGDISNVESKVLRLPFIRKGQVCRNHPHAAESLRLVKNAS